nr:hypothetical protein [Tanacetum cinerariifolium]
LEAIILDEARVCLIELDLLNGHDLDGGIRHTPKFLPSSRATAARTRLVGQEGCFWVSCATRVVALVTSLARNARGGRGSGVEQAVAGIMYIGWERRGFAE